MHIVPAGEEPSPVSRWRVADLVLDTRRQRVWRGGVEIPLPKLTYDLFATLVRRWPDVIADEELMKAVWPGIFVSPETVSQRVKLLRAALGDESRTPRYVGRLRGRGYHLVPAVEPLTTEEPFVPEEPFPPGEPVLSEEIPVTEAPSGPRHADVVLELSLVESADAPDQPAAPDWAVTQVLPLDIAAGIGPPPTPTAPDPAASVPVEAPGRRFDPVPVWLSWVLIGAALAVTGMVVAVLRAA